MPAGLGSLGSLGSIFVELGLDSKGLAAGLDKAETSFKRTGASLTKVGTGLTLGVSAPIVALGIDILRTSGEFESAVNQIAAVTGTVGTPALEEMRSVAKELGTTTKFSATQAAEGMAFLGQAGLAANEIVSAMPGLLSLAAAGQLELGEAADFASNIMSGFGLEASSLNKIADEMAFAAAASNTSVSQLAQALSFVAPVAKSAGISLEKTIAAIGVLGDSGIQATRAGTGLRGVIGSLISPADTAAGVLTDFGISIADLKSGALGPIEALQQLKAAGAGTADFFKVFGREAASAALVLAEGAPRLAEFTAELSSSEGAAKKMAEVMQMGLKGSLVSLGSAFEGLKLAIADSGLLEFTTDLVTQAVGLVRGLTKLSPEFLRMGVVVAIAAAALGPIILAAGLLATAIGTIGIPVAAAIAGVAALGAGFFAFREEISGVLSGLASKWKSTWETIRTAAVDIFGDTQADLTAAFNSIVTTAEPIFTKIVGIITTAVEGIGAILKMPGVTETFKFVWEEIKTVVEFAWNLITSVISGALDVIDGVLKVGLGLFTLNWKLAGEGVVQIVTGFWNAIIGVFDSMGGLVIDTVKNLAGAVTGAFSSLGKDLVGGSIVPDKIVDPVIAEFQRMKVNIFRASMETRRDLAKEWANIGKDAVKLIASVNLLDDSFKIMQKTLRNLREVKRQDKALKDFNKVVLKGSSNVKLLGAELFGLTRPLKRVGVFTGDLEKAFKDLGVESDSLQRKKLSGLEDAVDTVRVAMDNGQASADDLARAQQAYADALSSGRGATSMTIDFGASIERLTNTMFGAFVSGGNPMDAAIGALKSMGQEILGLVSKEVFGALLGQFDKLIGKLPGINKIGDALSKITGIGSKAGKAGISGGGGGGAGGFGGAAGKALALIDLGLQIFDATQQKRQINTLGKIEEQVRKSALLLGDRADGGIVTATLKTVELLGYIVGNTDSIKQHIWNIDAAMSGPMGEAVLATPRGGGGRPFEDMTIAVNIGRVNIAGSIRDDSDIVDLADAVAEQIVDRIRSTRAL